MLRDLFISKTRVKLLETLLSDPTQMYHIRDLVRKTGDEINAVRRELYRMETVGMVAKEPRGNRIYFWARKDYIYYPELLSLVAKNTGLGLSIIKNRTKLGKLTCVMFSSRFVRHQPRRSPNEVDILLIGDIVLPELNALISSEEQKRGAPINYTPMTEEELKFRRSRRDMFLLDILQSPRVIIYGSEEDLTG